MTQYLIRIRKLRKQAKSTMVQEPKKVVRREQTREQKALNAAAIEGNIEKELLERLRTGVYGDIYNFPQREYESALDKAETAARKAKAKAKKEQQREEEEEEEEEEEAELEDAELEEMGSDEESEEEGFGDREFVEVRNSAAQIDDIVHACACCLPVERMRWQLARKIAFAQLCALIGPTTKNQPVGS